MIIIDFIKNTYEHIKYKRILRKVYANEHILENLSRMFGTEFKMDWVGRVYTVFNPLIINGVFDPNAVAYEYTESGELDADEFTKRKIMEKMNVANMFIRNNDLFEILTYDIKKLDNMNNYLFTFQSITRAPFLNSAKKFFILLASLAIIAGVILLII